MKVRCISNAAKDLPKGIPPEKIWGNVADARDRFFSLLVGKEYVVYGITIHLGYAWYYICDEDFIYYPVWNPSALFEISDGTLPSCWRVGLHSLSGSQEKTFLIAFPEWVDDQYFYDRLTDGDTKAVDVFQNYRKIFEANVC